MRGKSLLNEKAIIILSLNQSECRKLLRSASSRIGFSLDTGIEESACKSSCRPLLLAIRKRSSKDKSIKELLKPKMSYLQRVPRV